MQRIYVLILVIAFGFLSCKNEKIGSRLDGISKAASTNLAVDHINIWVNNPKTTKDLIMGLGFTCVPDSLSMIHEGQGTSGRYFNFLNGYLELIFVYDQDELEENNLINNELDFIERSNSKSNGASPFSIALKVNEYKVEKIPFDKIRYHQNWMGDNANIFVAKNSKTYLKEPSIFVVYPEIESVRFETMTDMRNTPSDDQQWKDFFEHSNGAKKITNIVITTTELDLKSETSEVINEIENISIKGGKEHLMELYFDNNIQGKTFDLRPELPLVINL